TVGLRTELDLLLPRAALLTAAVRVHRETFRPRDLLERETRLFDSRRHSGTAAVDLQLPLGDDRLQLNLGSQVTVDDDRRYSEPDLNPAAARRRRDHLEILWGRHLGARCRLFGSWSARGHLAWYQRGPSFFELFGDRGAVIGNTELTSEHGRSGDLGLTFQADPSTNGRVELLEVTYYRSVVRDLIRFIQNSQRVSRPYNIGRARIAGMESRLHLHPFPGVRVGGSYVYQRATDRSPFSYHRGRDLPNAPEHVVGGHLRLDHGPAHASYEVERESRHYLDRANLRSVAARLTQGAGIGLRIWSGAELSLEVRNLANHQAADLWGYPLPGRAWFLSLRQDLNTQPKGGDTP
ncbi:MAG: TonB-dependent receptor, partial [Candidatus Latescibacterota bacterium]